MKKLFYLTVIIALLITSCTQEKKATIEGTWRLIRIDTTLYADTSIQALIKNGQMKTWSKEYFTYVGHGQQDTVMMDYYGGGKYKLDGNKYEENIMYSFYKPFVGTHFKALLEIRNDTLFQKMNSDKTDSYELQKGYVTEVYVRLK